MAQSGEWEYRYADSVCTSHLVSLLICAAPRSLRSLGLIRSWLAEHGMRGAGSSGALGLIVFWRKARGQKRTNLPLAHTRVRDNDALTYFATYLVPFVAVQAHSTRDRLALLLFLATIGVLYVRSALFYVNPLLALVGYRSFEVETEKGRPLVLLTRRSFMRQAEQVAAAQVSDYVFVELTSSGQHQVSSGRSSGTG